MANPRTRTPEAVEVKELRKKISSLERALGRKIYELEVAGISRQAIYRTPVKRPVGAGPGRS